MEASQEEEKLWSLFCNAAISDNVTNIVTLLQHRRLSAPSIDHPLLCESRAARIVRAHVIDGLEAAIKNDNHEPLCITTFKGLLFSPCGYETPWKLIHDTIALLLHNRSAINNCAHVKHVSTCCAEIQAAIVQFFQYIVSQWIQIDRKRTSSLKPSSDLLVASEKQITAKFWLQYIFDTLLSWLQTEHVINESKQSSPNAVASVHCNPPITVNLLQVIIRLVRDIDLKFSKSLLNSLVECKVTGTMIIVWLNVLTSVCSELSRDVWYRLEASLSDSVKDSVWHSLVLDLAESILALHEAANLFYSGFQGQGIFWTDLFLFLLKSASSPDVYSKLDTLLISKFLTLTSQDMNRYVHAATRASLASTPFKAHMVILINEAYERSGLQYLNRVMAVSFGHGFTKSNDQISMLCWDSLIEFACLHNKLSDCNKPPLKRACTLLSNALYSGHGEFSSKVSCDKVYLCDAGKFCHELFAALSFEGVPCDLFKVAQARRLSNLATYQCMNRLSTASFSSLLLASVVYTYIYNELPSFREDTIKKLRVIAESLCGRTECTESLNFVALLTLMTFKSTIQEDSSMKRPSNEDFSDVYDFVFMYWRVLPFETCSTGLMAMIASKVTRPLMLELLKKQLSRFYGESLRASEYQRHVIAQRDDVPCIVYSLCLLSSGDDLDSCTQEARAILFLFFIIEKYGSFPTALVWFCEVIRMQVREDALDASGVDFLLEIVVVKLLSEFSRTLTRLECFAGLATTFCELVRLFCTLPDVPSYRSFILESCKDSFRELATNKECDSSHHVLSNDSECPLQLHISPIFSEVADTLARACLCCFKYMLQCLFCRVVAFDSMPLLPASMYIDQIVVCRKLSVPESERLTTIVFGTERPNQDAVKQIVLKAMIACFYGKRTANNSFNTERKSSVGELLCLCHILNAFGATNCSTANDIATTFPLNIVDVFKQFTYHLCHYLEDTNQNRSLPEISHIFVALQYLCNAASNMNISDHGDLTSLRKASWDIYELLCSEEKAAWLVLMLESDIQKSNHALFNFQSTWKRFIPENLGIGDVDAIIRRVRLIAIQLTRTIEMASLELNKTLFTDKLFCCAQLLKLDTLMDDLCIGMEGNSGGICGVMFTEYVSLIACVCQSLHGLLPLQGMYDSAVEIYAHTLFRLKKIMSVMEFRCFRHLRGTVSLLFVESRLLPISLLMLRNEDSTSSIQVTLEEHDNLCQRIVEQCAAALEHEVACLHREDDIDVIRQQHTMDGFSDSSLDSDNEINVLEDDTMTMLDSDRDSVDIRPLKATVTNLAKWGITSICQSFCQVWLSQSSCNYDGNDNNRGNAMRLSHHERRTSDLVFVLKSAHLLLGVKHPKGQSPGEAVDEGGDNKAASCNFQLATLSARQKMCALLDDVIKTLMQAVETLRDGMGTENLKRSHLPSMSIDDALCYLIAWGCMHRGDRDQHYQDGNNSDTLLTCCIQHWYTQEVALVTVPQERHRSLHHSTIRKSTIVTKLQAIFQAMQTLEAAMHNALRHIQQNSKSRVQWPWVLLPHSHASNDVTLPSTDRNKVSSHNDDDCGGYYHGYIHIAQVLQDGLAVLAQARRTHVTSPHKRQRIQRRARRVRRQRLVRSRNPVIDAWLHSDRTCGYADATGNDDEDDAYADLEDFLVEG
jgi:hypothetical protein